MLTGIPSTIDLMETYGQRVKRLRLEAGFTNESALAKVIGLTREAVIQVESGKTKEFKGSNAVLAAMMFGVTTDYLITGVEVEGSSEIVSVWLQLDTERRARLLANARDLLAGQNTSQPVKATRANPFAHVPPPGGVKESAIASRKKTKLG